ncbi:NAD(P)/FAD-dependent oxidoreductase [Helicobacter mehlei]|uniref:Pyridine nucleotide-disulfide oxidoreductase n=1 Tax=Helicobacter mehlei TaxID=2316080 RepID=A0A553V2D1_9HELI|nr:FAD-dependent oxidoreductase [Helicobacter mehlei]TSA86647.1 pyridine nucleotide-disulfide oxidoreductase [Helicobacter mehlei]
MNSPRVLVLGAGYASLAFLKALSVSVHKKCQITLISKSPLHYFSTLLHEVAMGASQHALELSKILPSGVQFIEDRVLEIQARSVRGQRGVYAYDKLIVGLGFSSEGFGVHGVREHTRALVSYKEAQNTHQELLQAIQACKGHFSVVVCGGGFSGIELIGALSDHLPKFFKKYGFDPSQAKITCIEAMPQILPMFSDRLVQKGVAYLQSLGVHLEVGAKILECCPDRVVVQKEHAKQDIMADFIFWTCGVRGNQVVENSPFLTSARARVEVNAFLEPMDMPQQGIFVLGDCAAFKNPLGKFYPASAQLASQMGAYLGSQFGLILEDKAPNAPFIFQEKGLICSLGARYAIGRVGRFNFAGQIAAWLKKYTEWKWERSLKVNP